MLLAQAHPAMINHHASSFVREHYMIRKVGVHWACPYLKAGMNMNLCGHIIKWERY